MSSAGVEFKCFVGGLACATTDKSLLQAFSPYGEVIDSKIIMDRWTGRSRGFGFVTFREEGAMRNAIKGMDGQMLDGRTITVEAVRPRGSDGGGSRGPRYGEGGGAFDPFEQSMTFDELLSLPGGSRGPRHGEGGGAFDPFEQSMWDLLEDGRNITFDDLLSLPGGSRGPRFDGGYGGARWEQPIRDVIHDSRNITFNVPRGSDTGGGGGFCGPRRDGDSGGDGASYARREGAYGGGGRGRCGGGGGRGSCGGGGGGGRGRGGGGYGRREGGYSGGRRFGVMVKVMFFK